MLVSIHPPRVGRDRKIASHFVTSFRFNPLSPCGEGLGPAAQGNVAAEVSIHPPRVGRDPGYVSKVKVEACFNPPSPCGEGLMASCSWAILSSFNPPSPCGEGRSSCVRSYSLRKRFNPPSPCGERRYPHFHWVPSGGFQSTLPVWGGTAKARKNSL